MFSKTRGVRFACGFVAVTGFLLGSVDGGLRGKSGPVGAYTAAGTCWANTFKNRFFK